VDEVGSAWIRAIVEPASANIISIADITRAEVISAFARRAREGIITLHERDEFRLSKQPIAALCLERAETGARGVHRGLLLAGDAGVSQGRFEVVLPRC
jgi:hypothetical protein